MRDKILSVVKDYLDNEITDYALIINGAWGSGKTYFINEVLKSELEKIDCPKQKSKKANYKQIYVSLYGVSSIDEIKERMFYAINPKYQWIDFVSRNIVSMTEAIPKIGCFTKNLITKKETDKIRESVTNFDDKIIFFDDLERIDENKIDIKSILGYLNYLTEHKHYKIIVIANDENLDKEYQLFKEKTIRFSLTYTPNLDDVFDSVFEKRYKGNYLKFLKTQKKIIIDIFNAKNYKNIRTLIFITDTFQKVFTAVKNKYKDEINKELLTSYIIISIEAKEGHTKTELNESLSQINSFSSLEHFDFDLSNTNDNVKQEDADKEKYGKKLKEFYHKFSNDITFFPELIDLVFDGYIHDSELKQIINTIRNKYIQREIPEFQQFAKQLFNWTIIPNNEFETTINNVKNAIKGGKYRVNDILKIYASFIQIEAMHINDFKITELDQQSFKNAIDVAMEKMDYLPTFDIQALLWDPDDNSDAKNKYNELREYAIKINERHRNQSNQKQQEEVITMIQDNNVEIFKKFISDVNNRFVFLSIPPKEIVNTVISANAEIKQIFYFGLKQFFPDHLTNPSQKDVPFLENMKICLHEYMNKNKKRTVDMANLIYSQQYVDKVLTIYKQ